MTKKVDKNGRHISNGYRVTASKTNSKKRNKNKSVNNINLEDLFEESSMNYFRESTRKIHEQFPELSYDEVWQELLFFCHFSSVIEEDEEFRRHKIKNHNTWFDIVSAHNLGYELTRVELTFSNKTGRKEKFKIERGGYISSEIFTKIDKAISKAKKEIRPSKLVKLSTKRVELFKDISKKFSKFKPRTVELMEILKSKERVYNYFEQIMLNANNEIYSKFDIIKSLKNHLKF